MPIATLEETSEDKGHLPLPGKTDGSQSMLVVPSDSELQS